MASVKKEVLGVGAWALATRHCCTMSGTACSCRLAGQAAHRIVIASGATVTSHAVPPGVSHGCVARSSS
ncbi:hypothetical protein VFPFJ_02371 [Purpureocillium lilacinum]|uniref:Uncharacterized protein n=1 Tax=Purpureocillium lilacinum TaxID=33203 RepID=A0A179HUZ8_PURLI|nr:hypothetical protein VFPFJ_02371 [Purpureocillium lilacinum]OAQ79036.1 hypothetical protein VFPBJ_07157 [Purpureocillium lilacinum]OAQ93210.1 hypothetical protein VFPFJ_02371 [Purpureocillium lilacinum]